VHNKAIRKTTGIVLRIPDAGKRMQVHQESSILSMRRQKEGYCKGARC
jgi:hypothetical protein